MSKLRGHGKLDGVGPVRIAMAEREGKLTELILRQFSVSMRVKETSGRDEEVRVVK